MTIHQATTPNLSGTLEIRDRQARALCQGAWQNRHSDRDYLLLTLMHRFGFTVSELLEVRQADFRGGAIQLFRNDKYDMQAQLSGKPLAAAEVLSSSAKGRFLFSSQVSPQLDRQTVNYIVNETSRRIGVPKFTPSELRHLFGFRLASLGYSRDQVGVLMGLQCRTSVARYFHQQVSMTPDMYKV